MAAKTSERVHAGARLACKDCGTEVRMEQVGGGRMECCGTPLTSSGAPAASGAAEASGGARAHCTGCGNAVSIAHDGGGSLQCCNEAMVQG